MPGPVPGTRDRKNKVLSACLRCAWGGWRRRATQPSTEEEGGWERGWEGKPGRGATWAKAQQRGKAGRLCLGTCKQHRRQVGSDTGRHKAEVEGQGL